MDEAPPGVASGSLVAWAVGPTPEDPKLTNFAVAFADIWVDGVVHKQILQTGVGIMGPCAAGKPEVRTFNTAYRLNGIDLQKPHDFRLEVGKYVSETVRLNLSGNVLGIAWDK